MFFSFFRSSRPRTARRNSKRAWPFRPSLELLEGRLAPAVDAFLFIDTPPTAVAGEKVSCKFEVKDWDFHSLGPVTLTTTDPAMPTLPSITLDSTGQATCLVKFCTAGPQFLRATDGTLTGVSGPITVTPGPASKLAFATPPAGAATGVTLPPVKVQIFDLYGNVVTSDNTDLVSVSVAAGTGPFTAGSQTVSRAVGGAATFWNLTLTVPGEYALGAAVYSPSLSTFAFSSFFSEAPLQVLPGSFASSPSGFSVALNGPFQVKAMTPALYGSGFGAGATVTPTVTLTQVSGTPPAGFTLPYQDEGSLVVDPATHRLTFVATDTASQAGSGTPILPDGTYVARISGRGANGLQALGAGGGLLDGTDSGTPGSDFTTTFTVDTAAAGTDVVWLPATAAGPGQLLNAPGNNQVGGGEPLYLYNPTMGWVTSVKVTLDYNPTLLNVSGAVPNGALPGSNFMLLDSSVPGQAVFEYSGPAADAALLAGGNVALGFLNATVPNPGMAGTAPIYRALDFLHLSDLAVNGGAIPAAAADAVHLVAYVGDADGNGSYGSNDAVLITRTALQSDSGFSAYPLVDPVIVADTDGSSFIPADAAAQVNEASVAFPTANLPAPPIPSGAVTTPLTTPIGIYQSPRVTIQLAPSSDSGVSSSDGITNQNCPVFQGTATPGAAVTLTSGTSYVGTAVADAEGNWSYYYSYGLPDGTYSIQATVLGPFGSKATANVTITIDTQAPDLSAGIDPGNDSGIKGDGITNIPTPLLTGNTAPGLTVSVSEGGMGLGTAVCDPTGTWHFQVPVSQPLSEGYHPLTVSSSDLAGNTTITVLPVTIDTTPPATPTIVIDPISDTGIKGDNITSVTMPTYTGTTEPGASVVLTDGLMVVGSTLADASGNFRVTVSSPLSNGLHHLIVNATDVAGNQSYRDVFVTIDTSVPLPPILTVSPGNPTEPESPPPWIPPYFGIAAVSNSTAPVLIGSAEDGTTVRIFDGGIVIGSGTATGGVFSIPVGPLADGIHPLTAEATDVAGNTSDLSVVWPLFIEFEPPAVTVTAVAPTGPGGNLQVIGTALDAQSGLLSVGVTVDATGSGASILSGPAVLAVSPDGGVSWSFTFPNALPVGNYTVQCTAMNGGGLLTPATPVNVTLNADGSVTEVGNNPPSPYILSQSVDYRVDGTYTVTQSVMNGGAKQTVVTDYDKNNNVTKVTVTTPTGNGTSTVAETVTSPDGKTTTKKTDYKDQNGKVTKTITYTVVRNADGSKSWTWVVTYPDGSKGADASGTIPAGESSGPNLPGVTLTSATGTSLCPCDDLTADATPEVNGTADAGATVTLLADGLAVGSAVADSSGNWIFVYPHLTDGTHDLSALVTDSLGGSAETTIQVVIDTTVPVTSIVSGPAATTSQTTASFTFGSTKPGSMYVSRLDGTTTYYTAGTLNLSGLTLGAHSLVVTAIDPAGNIDPSGATYTWTVAESPRSLTLAPITSGPGGTPLTLRGGASDYGSSITLVNVTIRLQSDNTVVFVGPATSTGTDYSSWCFTFTLPPGTGGVYAVVTAQDAAGNTFTLTSSPFVIF
jgi:hypothetical protein